MARGKIDHDSVDGAIHGMAKTAIPKSLPTSPLTLRCPFCGAKPGDDCETFSKVQLGIVHMARVKAAAKMDKAAKATKAARQAVV